MGNISTEKLVQLRVGNLETRGEHQRWEIFLMKTRAIECRKSGNSQRASKVGNISTEKLVQLRVGNLETRGEHQRWEIFLLKNSYN